MNEVTNQQDYSIAGSFLQLGITLVLVSLIALTYRKLNREREDSHILMLSIIYIGVIMAGAMMLIASNFVVALGLFGAVSIVRFRTSVSNPVDMSYIFLSVVVGISCGLGLFLHGIVMTLFVNGVIILINYHKFGMVRPGTFNCEFTISAKKSFFTRDVLEKLNIIFHEEAQMLEIKAKKKKIKIRYRQQFADINDIRLIQEQIEPLYLQDPSLELAIQRKN
jgi:uncharacterized membrane protein YhiD involved in acid resistance